MISVASAALNLSVALDRDLDQLSTRTSAHVHAARSNKLGLVARVAAKNAEDRRHVRVVHQLLIASEETRDVTSRESGFTNDVSLLEFVSFGDAFQRRAEVAHKFFCRACPILWELRFNAMNC